MAKKYDLVIVGAGPAGLTAAVYAARYQLETAIIGAVAGGTITQASEVWNFPSYHAISGAELGQKMAAQVEKLGLKINQREVVSLKKSGSGFKIKTARNEYFGKKLLLATGQKPRKLGVPGEERLVGRGISYCATCDAAFFKNKTVVVVGGGNSALTAALLLAEIAEKVYLSYRRKKLFRADPAWIEAVKKNQKIELVYSSTIVEIHGREKVESVSFSSGNKLTVDGVFIEIGSIPDTKLIKSLGLKFTDRGAVIVNRLQETSLPGVLAAGDLTDNPLRQAVTAAAQGATAAFSAYNQLKEEKKN